MRNLSQSFCQKMPKNGITNSVSFYIPLVTSTASIYNLEAGSPQQGRECPSGGLHISSPKATLRHVGNNFDSPNFKVAGLVSVTSKAVLQPKNITLLKNHHEQFYRINY